MKEPDAMAGSQALIKDRGSGCNSPEKAEVWGGDQTKTVPYKGRTALATQGREEQKPSSWSTAPACRTYDAPAQSLHVKAAAAETATGSNDHGTGRAALGEDSVSNLRESKKGATVLLDHNPELKEFEVFWCLSVCLSLNSLWGSGLYFEGQPSEGQCACLDSILKDVKRIAGIHQAVEDVDWSNFFNVRAIDYKGDEVKVAKWFRWENIGAALPAEVGVVPPEEICSLGCRDYVLNFDNYLKPQEEWPELTCPRVMGRWVYLASRVLPMGFLNSVSLAQHVHRNLVKWSALDRESSASGANVPEAELRKDREFSEHGTNWRVYLDNYDLLEKVVDSDVVTLEGTRAAGILALRHEYEKWGVPRNLKKSVERSRRCELQGATIDGQEGVAFPREAKLVKYFSMALDLCQQVKATQKQWHC
ncbi:unnamed protein product, partial [Cladocopium goreaui]